MSYALVVDDDRGLLDSIVRAVRSAGLQVATATTWDEGLASFQSLSPSLVIADYNMPGTRHGLALLLEMAQLRPSVKFILMSAYLNDEDLTKVLSLGLVDDAFRKVDAVTTARRVLTEIGEAREASQRPTDWVAVATATRRARQLSEADFTTLDKFLRENRLPKETA